MHQKIIYCSSCWRLRAQGRSGVVGPITPRGSCQTVLHRARGLQNLWARESGQTRDAVSFYVVAHSCNVSLWTRSWKNMPMIAIMARRPLASSAASLLFLVSSSPAEKNGGFQPTSPAFLLPHASSPKPEENSTKPQYAKI